MGITAGRWTREYTLSANTTDNATATTMTYDGTNYYVLPTAATWVGAAFEVLISGMSSTGKLLAARITGGIRCDSTLANTTIVNNTVVYDTREDLTTTVAVAADTTLGALKVTVQGIAATTMRWTAQLRVAEVLYS